MTRRYRKKPYVPVEGTAAVFAVFGLLVAVLLVMRACGAEPPT